MAIAGVAAGTARAADVAADVGTVELPVELPIETSTGDTRPEAAPTWRFRVGLGVAVLPDYVGSDDYQLAPLPQFTASRGPQYVNITGTYLLSNLLPSSNWRLGPTAKFIGSNRCGAEDNRVNDMKCQSEAFMLGATGGYAFTIPGFGDDSAKLTPALEVLGDVSGANDGVTIEPQLNYAQRLGDDWRMALRGFATWGSENYETYYFGVDARQSRDSGLRQYDADGGFQQVGLLGAVDHDFTERWKLSLIGRYMRMVGDAEDSPLVDGNGSRGSADQWLGGVVVSYGW